MSPGSGPDGFTCIMSPEEMQVRTYEVNHDGNVILALATKKSHTRDLLVKCRVQNSFITLCFQATLIIVQ